MRGRPRLRFHRVTDWATRDRPEIAGLLHECDELAIKTQEVLRGKSHRVAMQLIMASAAHLLSLVDGAAAHASAKQTDEALKLERRSLSATRRYYRAAAKGEAQITYSQGMFLGCIFVAGIAIAVGLGASVTDLSERNFFSCLAAGAVGAVVSVIARVTSNRFELRYEMGRDDLLFLGGIRPLLGAVFGVALYFAVASGLLEVFAVPSDGKERWYFLMVIAFAAGFSERWAQDTLFGNKALGRPGELEATARAARAQGDAEP
jgi:hypothetical protein